MYETHDDDTGHVLAVHDTIAEAIADSERIAEVIEAQLAANGEGHRELFWVRLPIYDADTGAYVAASAYGLLPAPARADP
jgi:NAD(P)H-dependent FMN reductase